MSRKQSLISAFGALQRHGEIIADAAFENSGALPVDEDGLKVAELLVKHRLAFRTEGFGTQLNSAVMRLSHHVTKNYRLKLSSGAVADLLDGLREACEGYRIACQHHESVDQQTYEAAIYEQVFELSDLLLELVQQFSYRVHNEFSGITSLTLKIRENERSLNEIKRLNDLFSDFNINELSEMAGSDLLLNRLLLKQLKQTMDVCRKELVATSALLRDVLAKLQRDLASAKLNRLVDTLYAHYQRVPTFKPDLSLADDMPSALTRVEPLRFEATADLHSEQYASFLDTLAQEACAKRSSSNDGAGKNTAVIPVTANEQSWEDEPVDPVYQAVECFFDALTQARGPYDMTGSHAYEVLAPDVEFDIWLMALVSHFKAQGSALSKQLNFERIERELPGYSGNHWIDDVRFSRRSSFE